MKRIYLAGGMHNNWRGVVKNQLKHNSDTYAFLDPMEHKLRSPAEYTYWDLRAIRNCDILLAYMEQSNPSGWGMNLEIGYAKALRRVILLVIPDDFTRDDERSRYFGMARECADVNFKTLHDATNFLKQTQDV